MAKVYISYNQADTKIANELSSRLLERGHVVFRAEESLTPGQDWEAALSEALQSSEVFISLLTRTSINSQYVVSELGAALAYQRTSKKMLLIPVLLDDIDIPPVIRHIQVLVAPDRNVERIVDQIERAITALIGQRAAVEEKEVEVKARIEANAAVYIDDAIKSLAEREAKNRLSGNIWYYLGYITLAAGVGYGVYSVTQYANSNDQHWVRFAYLGLKSIIIIGLLVACSKYAFTLGKSYMSEALKSADRIHAISFGRFYLRAFSEKADWVELKEVFQHWNINSSSSFTELDPNNFDPKLIETLVEVARVLASKVETKK